MILLNLPIRQFIIDYLESYVDTTKLSCGDKILTLKFSPSKNTTMDVVVNNEVVLSINKLKKKITNSEYNPILKVEDSGEIQIDE